MHVYFVPEIHAPINLLLLSYSKYLVHESCVIALQNKNKLILHKTGKNNRCEKETQKTVGDAKKADTAAG